MSTWAYTFQDYALISSPSLSRFQRRRKLQRLDQSLNGFNFNFPPFCYDATIEFLSLGSPMHEDRSGDEPAEYHSKYNTRSSRREDDPISDDERFAIFLGIFWCCSKPLVEDTSRQEIQGIKKSSIRVVMTTWSFLGNGVPRKSLGKKKRSLFSTPSLPSYSIYVTNEVPGWGLRYVFNVV